MDDGFDEHGAIIGLDAMLDRVTELAGEPFGRCERCTWRIWRGACDLRSHNFRMRFSRHRGEIRT